MPKYIAFESRQSKQPRPVDLEKERRSVERIVAFCESGGEGGIESLLTQFGPFTPWVAFQLGCAAEAFAAQGDSLKATSVGAAALAVAREIADPERIYANLLTLGNISFRIDLVDEAEGLYSQILGLPLPGGDAERAGAHLGLGNICQTRSEISRAIYHFEKALANPEGGLPSTLRDILVRKMATLYGEVKDLPGLIHGCRQLGLPIPTKFLQDVAGETAHVDRILSLVTRLHAYGEHDLADLAFNRWTESQPSVRRTQGQAKEDEPNGNR